MPSTGRKRDECCRKTKILLREMNRSGEVLYDSMTNLSVNCEGDGVKKARGGGSVLPGT